ncbi:hypothetical protein ANRL3_01479 [Anaerolineae bacterium]|nr:hypothetical protein ANRL3_01479 [Anaerolineae bacterium]
MPKQATNAALVDGKKVRDVWEAHPEFNMKDVTLKDFQTAMGAAQTADDAVESMRRQLDALINQRNAHNATLTELTTRALSGIRGFFGPDSNEYEQAGGTRKSERKKPTRKTQ